MRRHAVARAVDRAVDTWPRELLMGAVRGYRFWFKPWLGNACRFEPTCSAYALQALADHGAWRGGRLAGARLLRCHPWCEGGIDPVPPSPALTPSPSPSRSAPSIDRLPSSSP